MVLSFLSSDMHQSHHFFGCHATGINAYIFFKCFALLKPITLGHKPNMNNSFRVIFIKFFTIKANIIKIYSFKAHMITTKCDKI